MKNTEAEIFENVSYKDYSDRFVRLDEILKIDNPMGITIAQAKSTLKAFSLSYLSLTEDLSPLQKLNAPELMHMAAKRLFDFEMEHE